MTNDETTTPQYPANWRIAADYDPNQHMLSLKGKAYLDVQNRLLWFVKEQRDFIACGLATCNYIVKTELVEHDRQAGFAHFMTYVRDVLGNEATMYGSEEKKDFGDYAEKASTKSLGRALAMLGYGTQYAAEMDEGERVVDSPVERKRATPSASTQNAPHSPPRGNLTAQTKHTPTTSQEPPAPSQRESSATAPDARKGEPQASAQQLAAIHKLCNALGRITPTEPMTYAAARELISELSNEYNSSRRAV